MPLARPDVHGVQVSAPAADRWPTRAAGAGPGVVGRDPQAARAVRREPRGVGLPPGRGPRPPAAVEVGDDQRALAALGQPLVPGRPHAAARQGQHRVQGAARRARGCRAGPPPGAAVVVLEEAAVPGRGDGPDVARATPRWPGRCPGPARRAGSRCGRRSARCRGPASRRRGAEDPDVGRAEGGHAAQHRVAVPPLGDRPAAAVPVQHVAAAVADRPDVGRRRRARVADEVGQPGRERPGPPGRAVPAQGDRRLPPPGLVPPNAQASARLSAMTAE